eukprot:701416-Pyramimonas_sp.AAC.1
MELTFLHHADFNRRVSQKLRGYPFKLLVLCKRGGHIECNDRRRVAQELIGDSGTLPVAARAFASGFQAQLEESASTGKCPSSMFVACELMAVHWPVGTQDIEGINNM